MGHQHGKKKKREKASWILGDPSVRSPIPVEHPSPPAPHPWTCPAMTPGYIPRLFFPNPSQISSRRLLQTLLHDPTAPGAPGPGVELRDGTWGKEWQFQDFQTDVDISPWRGKRGGKNLGNPFFLPKS